eukprot:TRINITY_DN24984_c0_g1_i1.p1 TRINITY_DN24984_c0_g1~~TRINITY_DN24984_c0_g1_i1.p1  ORF type:complete len:114 (-),score=1.88 TRINITY_DN24984_c0_g1_i1:57-398(-)
MYVIAEEPAMTKCRPCWVTITVLGHPGLCKFCAKIFMKVTWNIPPPSRRHGVRTYNFSAFVVVSSCQYRLSVHTFHDVTLHPGIINCTWHSQQLQDFENISIHQFVRHIMSGR